MLLATLRPWTQAMAWLGLFAPVALGAPTRGFTSTSSSESSHATSPSSTHSRLPSEGELPAGFLEESPGQARERLQLRVASQDWAACMSGIAACHLQSQLHEMGSAGNTDHGILQHSDPRLHHMDPEAKEEAWHARHLRFERDLMLSRQAHYTANAHEARQLLQASSSRASLEHPSHAEPHLTGMASTMSGVQTTHGVESTTSDPIHAADIGKEKLSSRQARSNARQRRSAISRATHTEQSVMHGHEAWTSPGGSATSVGVGCSGMHCQQSLVMHSHHQWAPGILGAMPPQIWQNVYIMPHAHVLGQSSGPTLASTLSGATQAGFGGRRNSAPGSRTPRGTGVFHGKVSSESTSSPSAQQRHVGESLSPTSSIETALTPDEGSGASRNGVGRGDARRRSYVDVLSSRGSRRRPYNPNRPLRGGDRQQEAGESSDAPPGFEPAPDPRSPAMRQARYFTHVKTSSVRIPSTSHRTSMQRSVSPLSSSSSSQFQQRAPSSSSSSPSQSPPGSPRRLVPPHSPTSSSGYFTPPEEFPA